MRIRRGQLAAVAIACGICCFSNNALAADVVSVVTPPAGAGRSLSVSVSGYITPKCTVDTRDGIGDLGDIMDRQAGAADAVSISLPVTISCNSPYEATLISKNGGLTYDGAVAPSFAGSVDYTAVLDMSRIGGGVGLRCDSGAMRGNDGERSSCRANSPDDISYSSGDAKIDVKLKRGSLPLMLGTYSDKLVLRLSPRV